MIRACIVLLGCTVAMLLALVLAPGLPDLIRGAVAANALLVIVAAALLGSVLHRERDRAEKDAEALRAIDGVQQRRSPDGGEIR